MPRTDRSQSTVLSSAVLRLLVVIALLYGLVPSVGEGIEAVVHLASKGHLAHFEPGETDLGDLGDEHGCGTTFHLCRCCVAHVTVPGRPGVAVAVSRERERDPSAPIRPALGDHLRRLFRPPIARG